MLNVCLSLYYQCIVLSLRPRLLSYPGYSEELFALATIGSISARAVPKPFERFLAHAHTEADLAKMNTALLLCDIQEKFRHAILGFADVVDSARLLLAVARWLGLPVVATEQNPRALGSTVAELMEAMPAAPSPVLVAQKTGFSMFAEPAVLAFLKEHNVSRVILVGLEAHICVRRTVKDALAAGFGVSVAVDGVSSQRVLDRRVALDYFSRLPVLQGDSKLSKEVAAAPATEWVRAGVELTTAETLVFELLGDASHPSFKEMVARVKERTAAIRAAMTAGAAPSGPALGVLHGLA